MCLQVYDPLQPTRGIGVIEAESNGAMGVKWNIYATEKVKKYELGATNSSLLVRWEVESTSVPFERCGTRGTFLRSGLPCRPKAHTHIPQG